MCHSNFNDMGKQSKITIAYFLNDNLKPYKINGENYYPIYLQITAKRKTTKIRSLMFEEYYTEDDYNDIMQSEDAEDVEMRENEISAINNTARLTIEMLGDFDTSFFVNYLNFSKTISVKKADIYTLGYNKGLHYCKTYKKMMKDEETIDDFINNLKNEEFKKEFREDYFFKKYDFEFNLNKNNKITGGYLSDLFNNISDPPHIKDISIYDFFGKECQEKAKEYIKENNTEVTPSEIIDNINKLLFMYSFEYFSFFLEANRKTKLIKEKYENLFSNNKAKQIISKQLMEKYGV